MPPRDPQIAKDPSSLPAQPGQCSFLTLPPEIRNKIYSIFVERDQPIRIYCSRYDFGCSPSPLPFGLLLSCRTIYHELASLFYSNNTFGLVFIEHDRYSLKSPVFVFIDYVGSQAHWLRNILVTVSARDSDAKGVLPKRCWETSFHGCKDLVDVTPYIGGALEMGVAPAISLVPDFSRLGNGDPPSCNASAVNGTINLLLQDKQLRAYARFIGAIGINYDGSGGVIVWREKSDFHTLADEQRDGVITCHNLRFDIQRGAKSLQWLPRQEPASWYCLPKACREAIFRHALYFGQTIEIDLDTDVRLPFGAALTNREAYKKFSHITTHHSMFMLRMSTNEPRSSFSNFAALRRLLRRNLLVSCQQTFSARCSVTLVLDFKLSSYTPPQDVRINILPFVLESSVLHDDQLVKIRIWTCENGNETLVAENTFKQRKLRWNVKEALKSFIHSHPDNLPIQIWIDGLGEVAECSYALPCSKSETIDMLASNVERIEARKFRIREPHFIDSTYRQGKSCPLDERADCKTVDLSQLFPFTGSNWEMYRYLKWVLGEKSYSSHPEVSKVGLYCEGRCCGFSHTKPL